MPLRPLKIEIQLSPQSLDTGLVKTKYLLKGVANMAASERTGLEGRWCEESKALR